MPKKRQNKKGGDEQPPPLAPPTPPEIRDVDKATLEEPPHFPLSKSAPREYVRYEQSRPSSQRPRSEVFGYRTQPRLIEPEPKPEEIYYEQPVEDVNERPIQEVAQPEAPVEEVEFVPEQKYEEPLPSVIASPPPPQPRQNVENESPKTRVFYSLWFARGMTFVALILLACGLYVLIRRPKFKGTISAKITEASCQTATNICSVDITYSVDSKEYLQKGVSVTTLYKSGDSLAILYDTVNPSSFNVAEPKWVRYVFGFGLTILSLIMIISVWWYYYSLR
jgi:hypothetical protein